jgi:hypothetical protein
MTDEQRQMTNYGRDLRSVRESLGALKNHSSLFNSAAALRD